MDDMVKVRFPLDRDEDGWPPAESEGLWAQPLSAPIAADMASSRYRIENTPWFVRDVAAGDIITAAPDDAGTLWFRGRVEPGGRLTIRLIALPEGALHGDPMTVAELFQQRDVRREVMQNPVRMVALDLGPDDDLAATKALLRQGEASGWWAYEEGCISAAWAGL